MNLDNLINKAFIKSNQSSPVLIQYTTAIRNSFDKYLSYIKEKNNFFYFQFPNKSIYMGANEIYKYDLNSKNDFKNIEQKIIKDYTVYSNNKKNNIIFGTIPFDLSQKTYAPWNKNHIGRFIIPMLFFKIKNKKTQITVSKIINKNNSKHSVKNEILSILEEIKIQNNSSLQSKQKTIYKYLETKPSKKQYLKTVNNTISTIKKNKIQKVVLSKMSTYNINGKIEIANCIKNMRRLYSNCFNYIVHFNQNHFFIGSSPENLITKENNHFTIDALAGTAEDKKDLSNLKETKEHKYVVNYIEKQMRPISKVYNNSDTKILKLKYAYHLKTIISGKIKNKNQHILSILKKLYPTPALAGFPNKEAMVYIKNNESFNRGLYGGAIGVFNHKGNGKFYVPIRSALIKGEKLFLFSGGGITKDSIAQNEWEETEIKLKHIKSIIGLKQC